VSTPLSWDAVVVNYDSGEHLERCVRSLLTDDSAGRVPDVVVVDNGSTDGSDRTCERELGVSVMRPGRNLGYARAANLGIAATSSPIVAVCNPDIVLEPGSAAELVDRFDREPDLGALGPRVENPDRSPYPSARSVPTLEDTVGHALLGTLRPQNASTRRYRQLDADPASPRDVDWVSGAAVWLRRRALDEVGSWNERYFMYVEDVELCDRLRAAGWRVAYEPKGRVVHARGASTSRRPYRMIVEHHRSLARYAASRWHGPKRLLLAPAVGLLTVRAGIEMTVHLARSGSGRWER